MKTQDYTAFSSRLSDSAKENRTLLRVMFELTYRCNFNCAHCYVPLSYRRHRELNTREVMNVLDMLKEMGCFYVGFTGGEPFLREDIIDILDYAGASGFNVIVYTNGSLINREMADRLKRIRLNKIDITLHSMKNSVFDSITGVKGSGKTVFNAVRLLRRRGVSLGFKTSVLKKNESEIEDIRKFANSLGALHRVDDMLYPTLDASRRPYDYRGELLGGAYPEDMCEMPPAQKADNNLFKCGVGDTQAAITPKGELKPCLMIDWPKYAVSVKKPAADKKNTAGRLSLAQAWKKLKNEVKKIKPDKEYKCSSCELKPFCKWCPARSWLYNRTFTSCDPESFRAARIRSGIGRK